LRAGVSKDGGGPHGGLMLRDASQQALRCSSARGRTMAAAKCDSPAPQGGGSRPVVYERCASIRPERALNTSGDRFSSSLERRHAPVTSVHGVGRDINWSTGSLEKLNEEADGASRSSRCTQRYRSPSLHAALLAPDLLAAWRPATMNGANSAWNRPPSSSVLKGALWLALRNSLRYAHIHGLSQ
jgi:hypothetical protein